MNTYPPVHPFERARSSQRPQKAHAARPEVVIPSGCVDSGGRCRVPWLTRGGVGKAKGRGRALVRPLLLLIIVTGALLLRLHLLLGVD